ncbi:MAG: PorV/PorQ family protein [Candidatus Stygibacter australis]|nr:PorV/PorQ family protein [Candidatus Stygibacter australis]MDP8322398.1 PorV/PorQ family protein [Candidatus Stygibacter australis]
MKKTMSILMIIFLFSIFYAEKLNAVGETGAQFLKIGVGAKACAMGKAFAGIADDPSAIYWNPAGLTQITSVEILGMQNFWLLDMSYQYLAIILPTRKGVWGTAISYSSSGNIPKYENFQNIGEYSAFDAAGTISYSLKLFHRLSSGLGVKYIYQKIEEETAEGYAIDIGLYYDSLILEGFNVGVVVQNLGKGIEFIKSADPLPRNIKCGFGYKYKFITLGVDVNVPRDTDVYYNAGGELLIRKTLAIRGGYDTSSTYSAGIGLKVGSFDIDYSYIPYKGIDDTHQISVNLKF